MTEYDARPPETATRRFAVAADGSTTGDDGAEDSLSGDVLLTRISAALRGAH